MQIVPIHLDFFYRILVLEKVPSKSSSKEIILTNVLKLFSIRTSGKKRQDFGKKINSCISYLKQKNILKVYQVTKLRVKLLPKYKNYLEVLLDY